MRDEYHFRNDGGAMQCPECGSSMACIGEQRKMFPPDTVVEVWQCESNPCHKYEETDNGLEAI